MANELRVSASKDELAAAVSEHVRAVAAQSISERGLFSVAVSGGSLPASLAPLANDDSVQWDKWHVLFVDERHVALDHADSNYRATMQALLKHVPIPVSNVHPIDASLALDACAAAYQLVVERIAQASGGRLDLVLLGMGEDGHTASLFPGHALLNERTRLVAPISDSPKPPPSRVTFTFPLIGAARNIAFVAAGAGKADPLLWIFKERRSDVPSGIVRDLRPDTIWFVDRAAVAKL